MDTGFKRDKDHELHVAMHELTLAVKAEFKRAIAKHGVHRTPANPDMPHGEKLIILVEETGEVARAMTYDEGNKENLITELIQVATMALACAIGIRAELQRDGV